MILTLRAVEEKECAGGSFASLGPTAGLWRISYTRLLKIVIKI